MVNKIDILVEMEDGYLRNWLKLNVVIFKCFDEIVVKIVDKG